MSTYAQVPLGEVCAVNPRTRRSGYSNDTLVSFVPMAAVDERLGAITMHEDRSVADVSKGYTSFEDGDVLFAKITPCMENGKAALTRNLTNGMGSGSTEFYVLRPGKHVLGEYVYHFVRQSRFREEAKRSFTGTAGQQRVPKSFMENALIVLPPLDEQRRIVGILNRAAKIERLRAKAQEKMREFAPALFVKMFGDPAQNPMGWRKAPLGDLIRGFQGGKNLRAGNHKSKFRILKVSAVTEGYFRPSMSKPAPDNHVPLDDHIVRPGDLLISRANTSALVGATAMVGDVEANLLLPDKIWRFVWREKSALDPAYVHELLKTRFMRSQLSAMATGTSGSMQNISQAKLKTLPVLVPPISNQQRFAKLVSLSRSCSKLADFCSDDASALHASLMSRLLGAVK